MAGSLSERPGVRHIESDETPIPPSNLTSEGEFNKYSTTSRLESRIVDNFLRTLESVLPVEQVRRVLEIGVGEGHVSERVASRNPDAWLVGIDLPHPTMVERWQRRHIKGVFGDAQRLPFDDRSFDLVLAIEVLEHLSDPVAALEEIARTAVGKVVLSVPLEPWWRIGNMLRGRYWSEWGNTPDHIQHWGRRAFTRLVSSRLDIVAVRQPLPWTLVVAEPRRDPDISTATTARKHVGGR